MDGLRQGVPYRKGSLVWYPPYMARAPTWLGIVSKVDPIATDKRFWYERRDGGTGHGDRNNCWVVIDGPGK